MTNEVRNKLRCAFKTFPIETLQNALIRYVKYNRSFGAMDFFSLKVFGSLHLLAHEEVFRELSLYLVETQLKEEKNDCKSKRSN